MTREEKEWFASFRTGKSDSAKKIHSDEVSRRNYDFFLGKRTSASFLSMFWDLPEAEGQIPLARTNLGRCEHFPYPTNSRGTRQEPLLLDYYPSPHNGVWATEWHVGTRFLRRIATIRFLGEYTLAGLNIPSPEFLSTVLK